MISSVAPTRLSTFYTYLITKIGNRNLKPFAPTKWLTEIFVGFNRFNKGEINEVRIEWTFKRIQD